VAHIGAARLPTLALELHFPSQQENVMSSPTKLGFDVWKRCLQDDCARQGKSDAFNALGDFVLDMFWKGGLEPTVQAIVDDEAKASLLEKIFHRYENQSKSA
jgi:hypothetical protein